MVEQLMLSVPTLQGKLQFTGSVICVVAAPAKNLCQLATSQSHFGTGNLN